MRSVELYMLFNLEKWMNRSKIRIGVELFTEI